MGKAYKGKMFAILLSDLSKDFKCRPHDLLIAKRNAYGLSFSAAGLIYLSNRNKKKSFPLFSNMDNINFLTYADDNKP